LEFPQHTRHVASIVTLLVLGGTALVQVQQTGQPAGVQQENVAGKNTEETGNQQRPPAPEPAKITIDGDVTVATQHDPDDEQRKAEQRAQTQFENRVAVGTLVLAAVATVGAILAYCAGREQVRIMRSQFDLSTMPRIYIDGVTATNFEPRKEPVFFLMIGNAGPVPAEEVHVFLEIEHNNGSTRPGGTNAVLVPANGYRRYDFRSSFKLPAELNELEGWNLRVKGTVSYADQTIPFCYKYNHWPSGERPDGVSLFVPCDFDNRRHVTVRVMAGSITARGTVATVVTRNNQKDDGDN
jgi:hypothetical protein